jgi:hypothetical protein
LNRLRERVGILFDELRNKGFIYDKDAGVNNPELDAIETLEIEDVNKNLERINGFLSEISDIFDVDDDVRSAIEEHTTELRAYRDYLKDAKNKLENRLVELTKNDSDKAAELYTEFKDECNTLLDDAYAKNTTIAIKDLEQILNKTKDFKNLVAT